MKLYFSASVIWISSTDLSGHVLVVNVAQRSLPPFMLSAGPSWIRYIWCINSMRSLIKTFSRCWVRITAPRAATENAAGTFVSLLVSSVAGVYPFIFTLKEHKHLPPINLGKLNVLGIISKSLGLLSRLGVSYFNLSE